MFELLLRLLPEPLRFFGFAELSIVIPQRLLHLLVGRFEHRFRGSEGATQFGDGALQGSDGGMRLLQLSVHRVVQRSQAKKEWRQKKRGENPTQQREMNQAFKFWGANRVVRPGETKKNEKREEYSANKNGCCSKYSLQDSLLSSSSHPFSLPHLRISVSAAMTFS